MKKIILIFIFLSSFNSVLALDSKTELINTKGVNIETFTLSSDWLNYYYIRNSDNKDNLIKNWNISYTFDDIELLSQNTGSFYFLWKERDKSFLIKDDKKILEYDSFEKSSFVFSDDGKYFYCVAYDWYDYVIILNWEEIERWINSNIDDFSNSLNFWVYINWNNFYKIDKDWDSDYMIEKNWKEIGNFDSDYKIYSFLESEDGKSYYYIINKDTTYLLFKDWKEISKYNKKILEWSFRISDNWEKYYFISENNNEYIIIKDWKEIFTSKSEIDPSLFKISKTWNSYYFLSTENYIDYNLNINWIEEWIYNNVSSGWFKISEDTTKYFSIFETYGFDKFSINWEEVWEYKEIHNLEISKDGINYFYIFKEDNLSKINKNWEVIWEYDNIYNLIISEDGESYYYIAEESDKKYFIKSINSKREIVNNEKIQITVNPIIEENNTFELNKKSIYVKNLIIAKTNLNKSIKWKKNIEQIDNIVSKINDIKLKKLYQKLDKIDLNNKNFRKHRDLLSYLKNRIWVELYIRWIAN